MRIYKPSFAVLFVYCVTTQVALCAQQAPTPFSTYGQIQNVQNYSTNPYWNKDSPYNLRMPTPIYATGADLNTGDCNRVVGNLIASFCASNSCERKKISDVRPTIMVQLSQLPGHNFATSCGGYIDSEFEKYQKTYGNVSTNKIVNPVPTTSKTMTQTVDYGNMFAPKKSAYEQGVAERTAELQRLQAQTTTPPKVKTADFPTTIADLSLSERMALNSTSYEPFQDMKSYKVPDIEEEGEAFFERLKAVNPTEYCRRRPNDSYCSSGQTTATQQQDAQGAKDSLPTSESPFSQGPGALTQNCDNPGHSADCPIILNLN